MSKLKTRSRSSPAHPRGSAPPSPSTWRPKARRSSSTTPPARRAPTASSPRSRARAARPSPCRPTSRSRRTIERLFAEAKKAFGRLDILVNNAGIYEFAPLEERHRRALPQAVRPERARPDPRVAGGGQALRPRRAAASSTSARSPAPLAPPNTSVYSATKAAVDAVTRSLAKELGPRKIRVNSINPGMVETEGVHAAGLAESDFRKQIEAQTPLGRIGQPQDIAPAAVFLASRGFRLDHRRDAAHLRRIPLTSSPRAIPAGA